MPKVNVRTHYTVPLEAVDVELPIYRKHDVTPDSACRSTIIYSRISASTDPKHGGFVELSVTEFVDTWARETRYEVESEPYVFGRSERDYDLGYGEHQSSAQEFGAAWARLRAFVAEVMP